MAELAEFMLAAMDLAEVRLVQARAGAYDLLFSLALLGLAGLFMLAGGGLLLAAIFFALRELLPLWQATMASAAISLVLGLALAWAGKARAS